MFSNSDFTKSRERGNGKRDEYYLPGGKGVPCLSHLCLVSINHKLVNVVFNNLNSKKEFEKLEDKKNVII